MSYFPSQVMPKLLMKETSKEVDMSPAIANAKDWNTIHKEIRSVEQLLIGTRNPRSLVIAGANQTGTTQLPKSLSEAVSYVSFLTNELFNGCWMNQFNGTIQTGNFILLPDCIVKTKTVGDIAAADTTITVESTKGFPSSGTITKFNGLRTGTYCESGSGSSDVGGGDLCAVGTKYLSYSDFEPAIHRTSQEIITYTSKTETQFLGCSRAQYGSTAEDLSGAKAVIVSGNASLFVSHNFWAEQDNPETHASEVYLSITPELYVNGGVLRRGTNQTINSVKKYFEASYALTVISDFQDINFSQVCGVTPSSSAGGGGSPDVPDEPPIILQSGFFRLDNMTLYEVGWHFCWEVTGIVVLPKSEIENTSKKVTYCQNSAWGRKCAVLPRFSSNSTIPLIYNEITPTYARFWNLDRNWNWAVGCPYSSNYCGLFSGIELSFRNYRTYGSLTVADVRLTASSQCYGWLNLFTTIWPLFSRNPRITSTLNIYGNTNLSATSSFTFPVKSFYYYWQYRYRSVQLQTKSNSVSYIVPNSSLVGWEKYFNI